MSENNAPLPWQHIYKTLLQYAPLWGGAAVLFAGFGMAWAVFSKDYWQANQPLVLRDEANGSVERLGRFGSQTQMKAAQETILEMASHYDVVRAALEQVGPESGASDPAWPTSDQVNAVAKRRVTVRPPEGGEFGSSEVIYLCVQGSSPERSGRLCQAVYDSLTQRLRKVRRLRADSIMGELVQARDLAKAKLDEVARQLRSVEVEFGSDLGELRNLSETFGDSTKRRLLDETQRELQAAELELEQLESLHALLVGGRENPDRLLVSGGELLSSQPSLLKMKDGLIEAQLQTSQLSGRYTPLHPRLRAAMETEREIRQQIREESAMVVEAMQPTLQLGRDKVSRLRTKQAQLTTRLERIAEVRTRYAALASEVKHRTGLLETAEKALTEAQASRAAALSVNLLAEVGPPVISDHPVGASGSLLTLGSATAGLLFGLGAVFLVAPGPNQTTRGRRWSDLMGGRRASDHLPLGATPPATSPLTAAGFARRASDRRATPAPGPNPLDASGPVPTANEANTTAAPAAAADLDVAADLDSASEPDGVNQPETDRAPETADAPLSPDAPSLPGLPNSANSADASDWPNAPPVTPIIYRDLFDDDEEAETDAADASTVPSAPAEEYQATTPASELMKEMHRDPIVAALDRRKNPRD